MTAEKYEREIWALCRVPRDGIFHLRYSIEAYEGLAVTTTLPGGEGLVQVYTEAALRPLLERVLAGIAEEMELEVVEWGEWSD